MINHYLKKWIKLIPKNKTILFNEYNRKDYFTIIANIVLDDEIFKDGKKTRNQKKKYINSIYSNNFTRII